MGPINNIYLIGSVSDKKEDSSPLSNSYKEALEKNLIKLIDDEKDDNLYTLDAIDGQNKGRLKFCITLHNKFMQS